MNIKTSTKEKFTVIYILENNITANMTAEIEKFTKYVLEPVPHVILNIEAVNEISEEACTIIASVQQQFYEKNCSFVVCNISNNVEAMFEKEELLDIMNITPTESEAWDIVQMEEIERELMDDFED